MSEWLFFEYDEFINLHYLFIILYLLIYITTYLIFIILKECIYSFIFIYLLLLDLRKIFDIFKSN